jgi:hypothetical protein
VEGRDIRRALLAAALALGLAVPAAADYWSEFEAGVDAYAGGRHAEAVSRFRPLAEAGDDRAQYWLGIMYFEGKGVPQDDVRAYLWLSLAAEQGNRGARIGRDAIVPRMSAARLAEAERLLAAERRAD